MYSWEELIVDQKDIVEKFAWIYFYDRDTIDPNTWMGHRIQKNPLDLFIYSEIAYEVKPDLIIETGSFYGGSAVWWRDIMRIVHGDDRGRVISIDPNYLGAPREGNIFQIHSSSLDSAVSEEIKDIARHYNTVLVNLDSLHDMNHVYNEMLTYHDIVTPGSYMIVEDGLINGHPTHPEYGPGPYEACEKFLSEHPEFTADRSRERMLITANPLGFLCRLV